MLLSKDGIFPITRDCNGHLLPGVPASGLNFPGTIQGEGKLNGIPSLFIRLAGCNLHCCWYTTEGEISPCDTIYAAYNVRGAYTMEVEDIYRTILQNSFSIRHIVITGGEPLLQAKELKSLCYRLKQEPEFHLTIETNATLYDNELAQYIDLFSLSPKLSSSHPGEIISTLHVKCIQDFIDYAQSHHKEFQLKFVYSCDDDINEIEELLSQLNKWQNEDILLMPLGGTSEIMRINTYKALGCCIRNGWRYCDRLHISLFGDKEGV